MLLVLFLVLTRAVVWVTNSLTTCVMQMLSSMLSMFLVPLTQKVRKQEAMTHPWILPGYAARSSPGSWAISCKDGDLSDEDTRLSRQRLPKLCKHSSLGTGQQPLL